ncbi:hypothetical protein QJ857_gp0340 [Tupanvirus soda lake]|uniref:Uncharacterized protein n=2 Tax=Tupanvirus TaxID=2094720 RepID=A0A6N1NP58_9VIRU|nr:hypothetical protein QJ857_gp0340 [Tupanvirus soda lake]QKU35690.1 hypothetical protein [Tupanvirus soda lake]
MSLCCFSDNEEKMIESFCDEGFTKVDNMSDLVGQTLNIRYYKPTKEYVEIGGVFLITRFEDDILYARKAPCAGSEPGKEVAMPKNLWYQNLSEKQAKWFIPPKVKRVREAPPPSMCPPFDGANYPISDPQNSFLPRESLLDTQCYMIHDNGGRPFKVLAHANAIEIYGDEELIWDEEPIYNILIARYTDFVGVWPGYDSADYSEFQYPNAEPIDKDNKESNDENVDNKESNDENVDNKESNDESEDSDETSEDSDEISENSDETSEDSDEISENSDETSEDSDEISENSDETSEKDEKCTKMWHCSRSAYGQIERENNNSVLIQLTPTEYVYVGSHIYSFKTTDPIINYFSPLGNNDVPYPVAYGENEAYFMLDQVYVNKDQIVTPFTATGSEQMYREFYGHVEGPNKNHIPMLDVKLIHERCC